MGRGVDAVRRPRDDDPAPLGESGGQVLGHVGAVRGAGAGPDHGDGAQRPGPQVRSAPEPEPDGPGVAEVVQLGRPLVGAGADEPAAVAGGARQVPPGIGERRPSAVSGEPLLPHPGQDRRRGVGSRQ